jgi:hypothetical protein
MSEPISISQSFVIAGMRMRFARDGNFTPTRRASSGSSLT